MAGRGRHVPESRCGTPEYVDHRVEPFETTSRWAVAGRDARFDALGAIADVVGLALRVGRIVGRPAPTPAIHASPPGLSHRRLPTARAEFLGRASDARHG
jgi:hypothetical protein